MNHETYCRLNEALKHLESLVARTDDTGDFFLACAAERVRNSIMEAFKASGDHPSTCR